MKSVGFIPSALFIMGLIFGLASCKSANTVSSEATSDRAPASANTTANVNGMDPVDYALEQWERAENPNAKVQRSNRKYYEERIKNALEKTPEPSYLKGKPRSEAESNRWFARYKDDLTFLMALQLLIEDLDKDPANLMKNKYYPVVLSLREDYEEIIERFKSTYIYLLMDYFQEDAKYQGTATRLLSWYKTEVLENFKKNPLVVNHMTTAFAEAQEIFQTSAKYCTDFCQKEYAKIKDGEGNLPNWRPMMLLTEKDFVYEKERFNKLKFKSGYLKYVLKFKEKIVKTKLNWLKKTGQDKVYEDLRNEMEQMDFNQAPNDDSGSNSGDESAKNTTKKTNRKTASDSAYNDNLPVHPCPEKKCQLTGNTFPEGMWSLTLDDGPHRVNTDKIMDSLKRTKFKASFFWLSKLILSMPTQVKRATLEGHTRSSHSMTHANLSKLNESGLSYEIDEAILKFEKAVGQKPTMFRCPYGACGTKGLERIAKHNMIHAFWNVDSLDWQDKDPNAICKRTIAQVEKLKRGIILFHDIHPQSATCVDKLLTYFRERVDKGEKVRLVTMQEAITELNGGVAFESP